MRRPPIKPRVRVFEPVRDGLLVTVYSAKGAPRPVIGVVR